MSAHSVGAAFAASFDYVSGSGRRTRQYTFAVPYGGREIRLSGEHTGFRWIDPGDVGASDLTAETARTVREWGEHHA